MSIHKYPQSPIVDELAFVESEGGHIRAYAHAAPGVTAETTYNIICELADQKWQVEPYSIGGKQQLEIHGFNSKEELIDLFKNKGWIKGDSQSFADKENKLTLWGRLSKRTLGVAGAVNMVGETAFMKYGYSDGNKLNFAAGILYGAGTLSLLGGGRKDPSDLQVRAISKKMVEHFDELNIAIPKDCALVALTQDRNKSWFHKADDFLRHYPSELMNFFYAAAGVCIAAAAYKSFGEKIDIKSEKVTQVLHRLEKKNPSITRELVHQKMQTNHRRESWLDLGLGGMTAGSGLLAMSIKEKAHDPDDPPKHGLAAAWDWIRRKPLVIAGVGYMISTLCHAGSTALIWNFSDNKRRESVFYRGVFVVANLIAELLLSISSKGHGEGVVSDNSVDNTVVSLAAELIVKQPLSMQDYLISHMAGFVGQQDVLAIGHEEATKMLRREVGAMRDNPWARTPDRLKKPPAIISPIQEKSKPWGPEVLAKRAEPQLQQSI